MLYTLSLALLMGIFWCQGSFAQTVDYEKLDNLSVEPGRIQFFFISVGNCYISEGGSINGVTYSPGESWWQTRVDAGSPWTEVPDTRRNGICSLDPSEPGEYRIIAEITIDGVAGVYTSSNTFTISSSGGPEPGPDPEPEPEPEPELSYRDQVQIMYVAYYGRPGDAGGLDFWAGKLEKVNGNLMEIINEFGNSMEFTERFGDLDDEELVNNIFLQLFGRDADSGGLNFYVNALQEGRFTLASLALNVADGTQNLDAMIKTSKLRAANDFSEAYVEAGADYGEFQIDDAKLWLGEVDSTEASVTAALDRLPDLVEMFSGGTTPEPTGNSFGVGDALPGVPTSGFFSPARLCCGVNLQSAGGTTTITFGNGGEIELRDGTVYTCRAAGGCEVIDGGVTRGTIVRSGGTPPPSGNQPDLVVGSPTVSDSSPDAGASFTLSATVRNSGSGQSAATRLRYYRSSDATISTSDTSVGTDPVGALSASGASPETISLTAPSSAGTYYYGACVDSVSGESSTANNCSTGVRVVVAGTPPPPVTRPDLVVGSPTVSDSSPDAGASFTLSATVRNSGGGQSAATTLRYYRSTNSTISTSDTEIGTDSVGGLAASGTSAESITLTAPSSTGTYYYGACVDSVTDESDTDNNCSRGVRVTVSGDGGGPAVTTTITRCDGTRDSPSLVRVTMGGTVQANRAVSSIFITGSANGDIVGIDSISNMSTGESRSWTISGTIFTTATTLNCSAEFNVIAIRSTGSSDPIQTGLRGGIL